MVWIITVDFLVSALQGLRNLHFMDLFSVFLLDLYVYLPVFQHLSAKIDKKLCMYIITQFYLNTNMFHSKRRILLLINSIIILILISLRWNPKYNFALRLLTGRVIISE